MEDIKDIILSLCTTFVLCFFIFSVKSCVIEQEKIALERLKTLHSVEHTRKSSFQSSGDR